MVEGGEVFIMMELLKILLRLLVAEASELVHQHSVCIHELTLIYNIQLLRLSSLVDYLLLQEVALHVVHVLLLALGGLTLITNLDILGRLLRILVLSLSLLGLFFEHGTGRWLG